MASLESYVFCFIFCSAASNIMAEMSESLPSNEKLSNEVSERNPLNDKPHEDNSIIRPVNNLSGDYSDLVIPDGNEYASLMLDEMVVDEKDPAKRALKKQRKLQRYLDMKSTRKAGRIEKRKDRQERAKLGFFNTTKTFTKLYSMADSNHKYTVVLDMSFEKYMCERDLAKCINQIARTYSANRRSPNPMQLHICSFNSEMKEELTKLTGMNNWDIYVHKDYYLFYFPREKIVYLTSDSENVLETVEEDKIYVIGGLVDHTLRKGVSLKKAQSDGVRHARLPLQQNIVLNSRTVLPINHVFEILLAIANGASWREAFRTGMPKRKIGTVNPRRPKFAGKIHKLSKVV